MKPLPKDDLDHVLEYTRSLWEGARGGRIFIAGGTGFFGAWLLESVAHCNRKLSLGLSATVLSRDPHAFLQRMPHLASDPSIQLVQGDIRTFEFRDCKFDFLIHGAAPTTASGSTGAADLMSILVSGTERVLEMAKKNCDARLLYLSSGAVYGRQPEGMSQIPEDYKGGPAGLGPDSAYAEGKRISERMCALLAREFGIQCSIARCFAFVGPHLPLREHFAIGNFIADALAGKTVSVRGDGTPVRSYLYAADLAIWLWTLLFRAGESGANLTTFNVGSSHSISIGDLAREVVNVINHELKVEIAGVSDLGAKRVRYVPDVRKAQAELGLRERIELREAIRRTAAWYQ
ncbi:MAG TPA: NAD-dependent epimerase/dehydratase family protein [Terracidiphilus sp.]|nr:NAD-dependent epimerase/dehydratase family protein [Terracidiphilus sp.]